MRLRSIIWPTISTIISDIVSDVISGVICHLLRRFVQLWPVWGHIKIVLFRRWRGSNWCNRVKKTTCWSSSLAERVRRGFGLLSFTSLTKKSEFRGRGCRIIYHLSIFPVSDSAESNYLSICRLLLFFVLPRKKEKDKKMPENEGQCENVGKTANEPLVEIALGRDCWRLGQNISFGIPEPTKTSLFRVFEFSFFGAFRPFPFRWSEIGKDNFRTSTNS